jgi:shikimate kinase
MNISLIGMMGSGKTTIGKILAEKTGRRFFDVDLMIEKETGKPIAEIFQDFGEDEFRKLEKKYVKKLVEMDNTVISTGGGLAADEENMKDLKKTGVVVWLYASPEKTLERVENSSKRPLLNVYNPKEKVEFLLKMRENFYRSADIKIDTTEKAPAEISDEIINFLEKRRNV